MKLVSVDDTGIYVYEYNKNEDLDKIVKKLKTDKINFYVTEKYNIITILK